jgi:hypothetical protein
MDRRQVPAVGKFCDCMVWSGDHKNLICILGLEIDTEIAEYLVLLFRRAIDREVGNFTLMNQDYAMQEPGGQSNMLHSFQMGMAGRLGDRLTELKSKRDFERRGMGTALVVVKQPIIQAAFDTLGIGQLHSGQTTSIRHQGAYVAGRNAAEGVAINQGVGTRSSGAPRLRR